MRDPASTTQAHRMGLGRKRRDGTPLCRAVRLRAAVLCVLLGLGLAVAGYPEFFWGIVQQAFPAARQGTASLPPDLLLRTAEAAHARGNYEASVQLHTLLVTQHPGHPLAEHALVMRFQALAILERPEAMRHTVEQLRVLFPRSEMIPNLLADLGVRHFHDGEYDQAARCYTDLVGVVTRYERISGAAEDTGPPRELTPATRRKLHNAKQARLAQRTEMERLGRFNLALCHDRSGKRNAALRAYDRFVRRFPADARSPEAWFRMGVLQLKARRPEVAVDHFAKVWRTDPAPRDFKVAAIYKGGRCLEGLRRRDEAREVYRLALELAPRDDAWRLASLTRLAILLREPEPLRALEVYRDLAENSAHSVRRAVVQQHLIELQSESAIASVQR
ncbi:MAG: tetratricopeptide repeat protein [Candidatus Latescibacterota bacterium]|nr:MAG: tetratricopeptide repeat protein [Candidatus Latescibacterota bacterium]